MECPRETWMLRLLLCTVAVASISCASGGCLTDSITGNKRVCLYINICHTKSVESLPVDFSGDISSASSNLSQPVCLFSGHTDWGSDT